MNKKKVIKYSILGIENDIKWFQKHCIVNITFHFVFLCDSFGFSLLLQNIESNNNDIKWKNTPSLSRSKTLPDLLCQQENDGCIPIFNKGNVSFV